MNIKDLLESTKPILYETQSQEWPYALSGTCYPVKYNRALYIISAFHCYSNINIRPECTLYPRPDDSSKFFAFDATVRARARESKDDEHEDQIILRVARSHHTAAEMDKVPGLELANPTNSRLPTSIEIRDFVVRGYPFDCPRYGIDYESMKISYQAYLTNGILSTNKSTFDFCYFIRLISPIPNGMHPNGMSGSPIYGITEDKRCVYCGTIIKYNRFTGEYLVIGPEILVNSLKRILRP